MTYASEVLADSPALYWRLADTSGTTAADSAVGGAMPGTWAGTPGFSAPSLVNDGSDLAVTLSGDDTLTRTLATTADTNQTFEMWFKTTGSDMVLANRDSSTLTSVVWALWLNSSGQITLYKRGAGGSVSTSGTRVLNDGLPHHVVFTRPTGSGTIPLVYIDGTLEITYSASGGTTASTPLRIGTSPRSDHGANAFVGVIDEVAYYTTVLSPTRIAAHYDAAFSLPTVTATLAGSGAFSAAATPVASVSAPLAGSGAFSAAVTKVGVVDAALTGSGSFSATVVPVYAVTGALTGSGTFSGVAETAGSVVAELEGSGAFTAAVLKVGVTGAPLAGSGAFTALSEVAVPGIEIDAVLEGIGIFSADVFKVPVRVVTGRMLGAGAFTADVDPFVVVSRGGVVQGMGSFTAIAQKVQTGIQRWVFIDPVAHEVWTVPINPDSMEPFDRIKPREMEHAGGYRLDKRVRTFVGAPSPMQWGFGGVIRTSAHYDKLVYWAEKENEVTIIDHVGRRYRVYLTDFEPVDRKPTRRTPWRLRYTMKAVLLEVPS